MALVENAKENGLYLGVNITFGAAVCPLFCIKMLVKRDLLFLQKMNVILLRDLV
jgi:hypothetical protein